MLSRDELAELLKTSPEALAAFEKSYSESILNSEEISDDIFHVNSRQAAALHANIALPDVSQDIVYRIVNELLAQTTVYTYKDKHTEVTHQLSLPEGPPVSLDEIEQMPKEMQPQLTGELIQKDISGDDSAGFALWFYKEHLKARERGKVAYAQSMYHHFRQGLDILDLDPILYAVIGMNENSMGHWLPKLAEAVKLQDFFKIPNTKVIKVPISLLQLTRLEYQQMTPSTIEIVNQFCMKAFDLDETKDYFVKTGTYSSKFDFRNAHVHGAKEIRELGQYLLFIHYQALLMASPLSKPSIYGVSTTNEWVVREFIHDKEQNPCIYNGMPLHTEYRVFVDFDTNEILGINPYWDPDVMKQRFGNSADSDSPENVHDYIIFKKHEDVLMGRYEQNKDLILEKLLPMLSSIKLNGQWSIDVMQNGDDFYIIDMALAVNSALSNCVPAGKLKPIQENWLPNLTNCQWKALDAPTTTE